MVSLPIVAGLAVAVLTTSFISGIFGMAGGMILMGVFLAVLPLASAMVLHGLTQMASNGWRAWLWRSQIKWPVVATYSAGAIAAVIVFSIAQVMPSKAMTLMLLGCVSFAGLLVPRNLAPDITQRWHSIACGAICSVLQLVAGVSGPVFDVFFVRARLDRRQVVATKAAIQVLGHSLKVVYFGYMLATGGVGIPPEIVILAILLAIVGTQVSRYILDAITDAQFRSWTRSLIALVASVYLVQGVSLLVGSMD